MRMPRIKAHHAPQLNADGSVWIGLPAAGAATELLDESGLVWSLCELMDGTRTREAVIADAGSLHPDADAEEIGEVVDFLIGSGWVEDAAAPRPEALSARDAERYRSGIGFLNTVNLNPERGGYDLQARLKQSRVAILGLGGVGSAVAMSLAASGIGELRCVDHDKVELSNLNRQLLYTEGDIGRGKVEAATDRLSSLNSDIAVTGRELYLDGPASLAAAIEGCDVFVLCADEPREWIRSWANQAAYAAGIPWLTTSYFGPKYTLSCFVPGATGCFACLPPNHAEDKPRIPAHLKADHAVIAASAQIAGHFAALEAIHLLTGLPVQTAGRELTRFLVDYDQQYYRDAEPRPDCPVGCGRLLDR